MSYQVFARKYRPQNFDEVVGQEHITRTLKNAIEQNRLAHAYLFVGPRGTGKTSTARILAKALNCDKGPTVHPCNECPACREISAGTSFNVLEFDAASNTQVDKVRELIIENVKYRPTSGRYKMYIVDEVHMLSPSSFNALLKTLEEPPEHVIFVFATTDPQKVPVTIISRCQRFDLRRIPAPLIAKHLQFIAKQEKIKLDEAAAQAIAKGAEGGLRDAESMLDQLVAFCGNQISEQDVLNIFGFTAQQTVSDLCAFILEGKSADALGAVHEQAEKGKDLSRLMSDLITHQRDLLIIKADPQTAQEDVSAEYFAGLKAQAEMIAMDRLLGLIEQFADAENRMKWAPNKKLHFEIAVIKAVQTLAQTTLTEILDALAAMRSGENPTTVVAQRSSPPSSQNQQPPSAAKIAALQPPPTQPKPRRAVRETSEHIASPVTNEQPGAPVAAENKASVVLPLTAEEFWPGLLTAVRKQRPLISSWIEAGALLNKSDTTVVIGFPLDQKLAMESLLRVNNRTFLESLSKELTGQSLTLKCELREGLVVEPVDVPETKPEPPPDPMESFKNDPLIRRALEIFRAEIQPA